MSEPVTRWVEPCAGMLAVALRLRGGDSCVPPIAYMGGKRSFARPIMAGLGLRAGQGCRDLWVADAGPPGEFWSAIADAERADAMLARLDGWVERWPRTTTSERELYDALVANDATHDGTDPAAWLVAAGWSYRAGDTRSCWGASSQADLGARKPLARLARLARLVRLAATSASGIRVWRDARAIPVKAEGRTIVLLDPPYDGTTGYSADLPRDEVRALALRWYEAGAEVVITEREPVVPGWRSVRLDREGGQTPRTLWERATLSPNVRWRIGEQPSLFGGDDLVAPRGSAMVGGAR